MRSSMISRSRRLSSFLFCAVLSAWAFESGATDHVLTQVDVLGTPDSRPCTIFSLTDGTPADPITGSSVWYSIPQSATNYKERLAMLWMSKMSGRSITVSTDGVVNASGIVGVANMYLR